MLRTFNFNLMHRNIHESEPCDMDRTYGIIPAHWIANIAIWRNFRHCLHRKRFLVQTMIKTFVKLTIFAFQFTELNSSALFVLITYGITLRMASMPLTLSTGAMVLAQERRAQVISYVNMYSHINTRHGWRKQTMCTYVNDNDREHRIVVTPINVAQLRRHKPTYACAFTTKQ